MMAKKKRKVSHPRPGAGLAAGIVAGLVASAAVAAFQAKAAPIAMPDSDPDDAATVKAANAVAVATTGEDLPKSRRATGGQLIHYAVGAALGGIYGIVAEYRPSTRAGFGSAYGVATSVLLDETAIPAAGLSDSPEETPLAVHAYGLASHVVFGLVLDGTRALLVGRRR